MYYYQKITDDNFADTESALRESLKRRGFGILTEIDVQKTMKAKLGIDVPSRATRTEVAKVPASNCAANSGDLKSGGFGFRNLPIQFWPLPPWRRVVLPSTC